MKNIYLLRHAKSSRDDPSLDDFDRPLNKRGRTAAKEMGLWMADWIDRAENPPQRILVSPAVRTRQTLAGLGGEALFPNTKIVLADAIYEAGSEHLRSLALEHLQDCDCILIIGHNPGLEMLILETDPNAATLVRNNKLMPTAAFCALEISRFDLEHSVLEGNVVELVRPRDL